MDRPTRTAKRMARYAAGVAALGLLLVVAQPPPSAAIAVGGLYGILLVGIASGALIASGYVYVSLGGREAGTGAGEGTGVLDIGVDEDDTERRTASDFPRPEIDPGPDDFLRGGSAEAEVVDDGAEGASEPLDGAETTDDPVGERPEGHDEPADRDVDLDGIPDRGTDDWERDFGEISELDERNDDRDASDERSATEAGDREDEDREFSWLNGLVTDRDEGESAEKR